MGGAGRKLVDVCETPSVNPSIADDGVFEVTCYTPMPRKREHGVADI